KSELSHSFSSCIYHDYVSSAETKEIASRREEIEMIEISINENSQWAKFENTKYSKFNKQCLVNKQLKLQISHNELIRKGLSSSLRMMNLNSDRQLKNIDWKNFSLPVTDQGLCGSCWAFASSKAFSAQMNIDNPLDEPLDISVQMLVDCDIDNNGCNGGMMDRALEYLDSNVISIIVKKSHSVF
ncbi:MAG: hypothetical protein MHPSP_003586, partial [Paramarteilia canceri]